MIPVVQELIDQNTMPASLQEKLAEMMWYLEEHRAGWISNDAKAFDSYLDDPEVAEWLDKMKKAGRVKNTRFTRKR